MQRLMQCPMEAWMVDDIYTRPRPNKFVPYSKPFMTPYSQEFIDTFLQPKKKPAKLREVPTKENDRWYIEWKQSQA